MPALTTVKSTAKTRQLPFNVIKGSTINSSQPSQSLQQQAAYWHKIMTSTGSQTTFTTSFWIKRTALSTQTSSVQEIWNMYDGTQYFEIYFDTDDTIKFSWQTGAVARYTTTKKFRDLTAWYHIVIAIDTTQATAANRRKLYVNGIDLASDLSINTGSEIVQNSTVSALNKVGVPHRIGHWATGGNYETYANFSEFYHIDGRQLTQYDFGGFNTNTGQWQPKKFSGNTQWTRYVPTTGMLSQSGLQSFNASLVFDNDITTSAFFTDSSAAGSYLQWDLGAGNTQAFRRIRFQFNSPTAGLQATWNVQYSDDASSWTSVQTGIVSHPDYSLTKRSYYYEIYASWGNVGAHRYWRIYKTNAAAGGDYCTGVDFYTLSGIDYYGSCGFYLPFDRLFDKNVTNVQLPDLGDTYFTWSGRGGSASVTDDRSQSVTVNGSPTVNTSGGPKTNNGYYLSGFAQPTVNATLTGAVGLIHGDSTNLSSLPSTGQTWACWLKSSSTKARGGQFRVGVTAFGDYRNSVYAAFGLNNGRVAFGMSSVWEGTTTLSDGNWHHIAMVYDGGGTGSSGAGTLTLYADGRIERVIRSSQETDQTAWNSAKLDCIGFTYAGYGEVSPTAMTGICIYKRALSDTEILGLYNGWDPISYLDRSGNSNDFYSVGTRTDLKDSPTNFGNNDTGAGGEVIGNYPIMQPLSAYDGAQTFGGLTTTTNDIAASMGVFSGKWYWEYQMPISDDTYGAGANGASGNVQHFGITFARMISGAGGGISATDGRLFWRADVSNGAGTGTTLTAVTTVTTAPHFAPGDYVGFALDMDASPISLRYYRNGVAAGQHTATTNGISPAFPFQRTNGYTGTMNFGQWPFRYAAPAGYKTINTKNLPKLGIVPSQHFGVVAYAGNGTNSPNALTVSGLNFQPDLVWIKNRTNADSNWIQDTVRGLGYALLSDSTGIEAITGGGDVSSVNSTGFVVSYNNRRTNGSSNNYIAWCWKAGNGTTTNTDGAVTSTISVNQLAGFSIVTYAGTGSNTTTGHGLGSAPDLIIWKSRDDSYNWDIYLSQRTYTATTTMEHTNSNRNVLHTAPTATTIPVTHTYTGGSANGKRMVAYCWKQIPGYSSFGSYTGNSSNPVFVNTGFKPAFVTIKPLTVDTGSASTGWRVFDNVRNTSNLNGSQNAVYWSSSGSEVGQNGIDFTSTGFYMINSGGDNNFNRGGCTYAYIAFAEVPTAVVNARV
jgi:hypothetical protein